MLLLTSTSDIVRVVTGTGVSTVTVHASWVDNASGTITPGRTNTNITGAGTTTVVAAPGSSTQRNVRSLYVTNNNATTSTQVTVQHFDGTTSTDLMGVTLLPGENLILDAEGGWHHHDSQGGDYTYAGPPIVNLGITGTLAESMPRETCPEVNTTAPASGTLANTPAPACTRTTCPCPISFFAVSGVTATRASPAIVSAGTPINMGFSYLKSFLSDSRKVTRLSRGLRAGLPER